MAELYRHFGKEWEHCLDFSDGAIVELYNSESYGTPCKSNNGYLIGKKWLNVTVTVWKEDIEKGLLFRWELYDEYPSWWLDSVFKR